MKRVFTDFDCALLRELVRPHRELLNGKSKKLNERKRRAWESIYHKYCSFDESTKVTLQNLKVKWSKIKSHDKIKKAITFPSSAVAEEEKGAEVVPEKGAEVVPEKGAEVVPEKATPTTQFPTVRLRDLVVDFPALLPLLPKPTQPTNKNVRRSIKYVRSVRQREELTVTENKSPEGRNASSDKFAKSDAEEKTASPALEKQILQQKLLNKKRKLEMLEAEHQLRMEILQIQKTQLSEFRDEDCCVV